MTISVVDIYPSHIRRIMIGTDVGRCIHKFVANNVVERLIDRMKFYTMMERRQQITNQLR